MPKSQQSWVRSQHPPTQLNRRGKTEICVVSDIRDSRSGIRDLRSGIRNKHYKGEFLDFFSTQCLFRIPDLRSRIPDLESRISDTAHISESLLTFFWLNLSLHQLSSRKYAPGCSSWIRILFFNPSRIQGSKKHRIPDPQHWIKGDFIYSMHYGGMLHCTPQNPDPSYVENAGSRSASNKLCNLNAKFANWSQRQSCFPTLLGELLFWKIKWKIEV